MAPDGTFRDGLIAALPSLRAFAISLTQDSVLADDLVQETILKGWANAHRFEAGTNLLAWLFTILRNCFYSNYRSRKHYVEDPEGFYLERLRTGPEQISRLEYEDFRNALAQLRPDQREALILVGAEGLSYDEAAAICGVPVGTIKSRVNRARCHLHRLLSIEDEVDIGPDSVTMAALQEASRELRA
jgi:RNA polymerase sigma-70 factor (ECF subfamily)